VSVPAAIPVELLRALFDAYPAPTYLVDEDIRIELMNRAAAELSGGMRDELPPLMRSGEALHCLNGEPSGCGAGGRCGECVVRTAVRTAVSARAVHRAPAFMQRRLAGEVKEAFFLVTASPFDHGGRPLVLLTLEDVTAVARLKSLLPMCAGCRKIRNDSDYWQSVEAYLKEHHDVDVSHGFCEECVERLYPGVLASRPRGRGRP
jgi:hypothetical protein